MNEISERIEQIRERVEAATEGPWEMWTGSSWRRIGSKVADRKVVVPIKQSHDGHPDLHFPNGGWDGPDAEFLTNARSDVPYLLSLVEEVGEALAVMNEKEMETWRKVLRGHTGDEVVETLDALRDAALEADD